MSARRLWLCLPVLFSYSLDVLLTLSGQSAAYWDGDYSQVLEGNPVAWLLLTWHPLIALLAGILWAVLFSAVLVLWKNSLAVVLAFGLAFSHAIGAASWLWHLGWGGKCAALMVLLATERLVVFSWKAVRHSSPPASSSTAARKPL